MPDHIVGLAQAMASLSRDAVIFGLAYLNGPSRILRFGGEGASMGITDRARSALRELVEAGFAEPIAADCATPGREHYRGVAREVHLGAVAQAIGLDPFTGLDGDNFRSFVETAGTLTEAVMAAQEMPRGDA